MHPEDVARSMYYHTQLGLMNTIAWTKLNNSDRDRWIHNAESLLTIFNISRKDDPSKVLGAQNVTITPELLQAQKRISQLEQQLQEARTACTMQDSRVADFKALADTLKADRDHARAWANLMAPPNTQININKGSITWGQKANQILSTAVLVSSDGWALGDPLK